MRKLTLRHEIELLVLAVDNRPGGNLAATYTLARLNLRFATFLAIIIAVASLVVIARQDMADFNGWLTAWLNALNPLAWTMDDLRVIWYAVKTLHLVFAGAG